MAKTNRGKGLWDKETHGRGTCPICKRTRVKLLYDLTLADDETIKVCKHCKDKDAAAVAVKSVADLTATEKNHQAIANKR